mmetsp:Transcript_8790/g.14422  ORF Transcript_8790/g.14422 Transcript_8790/m.14422 type:complete len:98 (+) Transcript_8790:17-310(+)
MATAALVSAHFGKPACEFFNADLVASFTAKKTAPAGIFDNRGATIPSNDPLNNIGKFCSVYGVFGICNRTVAVSRGYFTSVLTVETAVPDMNPDILS